MARTTSNSKFDNPASLMLNTRRLLNDRDLLQVHRETLIPYHWLLKFHKGTFNNPSVNRVQYLYEQLSGLKIRTIK